MRVRALLVVVPAVVMSAHVAEAQSWTAAEQVIIDRTIECQQAAVDRNKEVRLGCYHRSYSGWNVNMPVPQGYDQIPAGYERNAPSPGGPTPAGFYIQPLAVRLAGNTATIHYYLYAYFRRPDGTLETRRSRWTALGTWRSRG